MTKYWRDPKTKTNKDCFHYTTYQVWNQEKQISITKNFCNTEGKDKGTCGYLRKTGDCQRRKK